MPFPDRKLTSHSHYKQDVKLYSEALTLRHPSRFPDLQINGQPSFSYFISTMDYRAFLPAYSDRIAQDSHLIPSLTCKPKHADALVMLLWNLYNMIVSFYLLSVNFLFSFYACFFKLFLLFQYSEKLSLSKKHALHIFIYPSGVLIPLP